MGVPFVYILATYGSAQELERPRRDPKADVVLDQWRMQTKQMNEFTTSQRARKANEDDDTDYLAEYVGEIVYSG